MNIKKLIEDPSEYDFYQAIYTIERQLAAGKEQQNKVGHDSIPKNELIRFISDQNLGYPGSPISKVEKRSNVKYKTAYDLHVSFMGVTGTNGALPQHYTELVLERLKYKDTGMRDFFDLFNHRLLSLYYRAWEKYKFPIAFEKNSNSDIDAFSKVLNQLSGTNSSAGKYYAGFLNHSIRSVEGLKQILTDFTGCKVDIEQFQGKWQMLDEADQTRLGQRSQPEGQFAQLGVDACIGNKVWDINSDIKIIIKPAADAKIEKFLNNGSINRGMKDLITQYLGRSIHHKLQLELLNDQIPVTRLSKNTIPLGKGGGLASRDSILKNKTTIYL
jgi:type VI secretion system protein ImpH